MTIGRSWLLGVVVLGVFLGSRWVLADLTDPRELRERIAALEEREGVRRFPRREDEGEG